LRPLHASSAADIRTNSVDPGFRRDDEKWESATSYFITTSFSE
jgi:hypothetical protein